MTHPSAFPFTDHRTVAETEAPKRRRFVQPMRPMPDDFPANAAVMNIYTLVRHYRTADKVIKRWCAECGVTPPSRLCGRPVPDNFAALCADHTIVEIMRMFDVDRKVVRRWASETGIEPKIFDRSKQAPPPPRQRPANHGTKLGVMGGGGLKLDHNNRPRSIWDDAADILRAERWIVYRCNEKGQADPKGRYWRMGQLVLEPDDLLRRADRYRRRCA